MPILVLTNPDEPCILLKQEILHFVMCNTSWLFEHEMRFLRYSRLDWYAYIYI